MEISAGQGNLILGCIRREPDNVDGILIRSAVIPGSDYPVLAGELVELYESDVVIWFETQESITVLREYLERIEHDAKFSQKLKGGRHD